MAVPAQQHQRSEAQAGTVGAMGTAEIQQNFAIACLHGACSESGTSSGIAAPPAKKTREIIVGCRRIAVSGQTKASCWTAPLDLQYAGLPGMVGNAQ